MASETNLLEKTIDIMLVDPWDFVTVNGSGPFVADVLQFGHDASTMTPALFLELHVPSSATPKNANSSWPQPDMMELHSRNWKQESRLSAI